MSMQINIRAAIALLLIPAALAALCACDNGTSSAKYKILVDGLGRYEYSVGFRKGDNLCLAVEAALQELEFSGAVADLSRKWFGKDLSLLAGNETALDELGEIPERTLIMGLDAGKAPFSFLDDSGVYQGYDVELAIKVCALLGWELKFQPIKSEDAVVELNSGNVDCAWGGMSFAGIEETLDLSSAYMESKTIIVVKSDSGINTKKKLAGKDLAMTFDPVASAGLDANNEIKSALGSVKKLGSVRECFSTLSSGACDAILVDKLSAEYYWYK